MVSATNGFDQQVITDLVGQIEEYQADMRKRRDVYMQQCQAIREGITAVYGLGTEKGIPRKALRGLIHTRELERKIEESVSKLEGYDRDSYDMLEAALGDYGETPLGQAALSNARHSADEACGE